MPDQPWVARGLCIACVYHRSLCSAATMHAPDMTGQLPSCHKCPRVPWPNQGNLALLSLGGHLRKVAVRYGKNTLLVLL
jgi:hypothetical protein